MDFQSAQEKLAKYGQEHVLKYYDELSDTEKEELLAQIEDTDFAVLENCKNLGKSEGRGQFAPLAAMQVSEIKEEKKSLERLA